MKKWLSLFLALVMCLALCACGGNQDQAKDSKEAEPAEEESKHDEELLEAINIFLDDDESRMADAMHILESRCETFSPVSVSDLTGSYFEISVDTFAPYWYVYKYKNNTLGYTAMLEYTGKEYRIVHVPGAFFAKAITENDDNSFSVEGFNSRQFLLRKITDNIFLQSCADDTGAFTIPYKLMFRYDEPVTSMEDAYEQMLPYIRETLLPELP